MAWSTPSDLTFIRRLPARPVAVATSAFLLLGSAGVYAGLNSRSEPTAAAPAPVAHRVTAPLAPALPVSAAPVADAPAPPPGLAQATPVIAPVAVSHLAQRAVPAALVVRPPAPAAPVPTVSHSNYLSSDDGTLNTSVGTYSDCSGSTPLGPEASILSCIRGRLYFAGHNVGVFTPLLHMGVGSGITYWDGGGRSHHFRVVSVRPSWAPSSGLPPVTQSNVVAQFQTCAQPDGSIDRILDATLDGGSPLGNLVSPVVAPVVSTVNSTTTAVTTTTTSNSFWGLLFGGGRH